MDRLILFRHGKAESSSPSGDDFDRPLASPGEAEAAQMGRRLAEMGAAPDLALVSAAARTRQTWAAAAAAFQATQVRVEDGLYHAESEAVRRIAETAGADFETVLVVGHNPGLHELTLRLMLEVEAPGALLTRAQLHFPTAAVAIFDLTPGRARAVDLLLPRG